MKRTIGVWTAMIAFVALVGTGYVYWQNSMEADKQNATAEQRPKQEQVAQVTEPNGSEAAQDSVKLPGEYKDYEESLVSSTNGDKILFFHAPWCPQCRMIESDIKEQGVPSGVTVLKVDYDSNQALRQKYGVTLQTTFVEVDSNGTEIDKYVAYNEPNFDSVKANLLNQ